MYAEGNPKTKKELKAWVEDDGRNVRAFLPNSEWTGFHTQTEGVAVIEGPQYPKPHRWYAQVLLEDGEIVKVIR
jgi:hypothetical protein